MDTRKAIVPAATQAALVGVPDAAKLAALFEEWAAALAPATRRNYAQDLAAFAAHVGAQAPRAAAVALCSAAGVDARSLVLGFKTSCRDKGEAPASINRRLSALRSLYRHVVGAPLVVPSVKAVRRRRTPPGNGGTVAALLVAAAAGEGTKGLRDSALVLVLHDSGLRRAELATLRVKDLDLGARVAYVMGKGLQGERAAHDLSAPAVAALASYLAARGPLAPDAPAFANLDRAGKGAGALSTEGIRVVLAALSRRAGLAQAVAPHDLRRHGARALAKAGASAETLRRWGRWADYRTPARYVGEVAELAREGVDLLAKIREATV